MLQASIQGTTVEAHCWIWNQLLPLLAVSDLFFKKNMLLWWVGKHILVATVNGEAQIKKGVFQNPQFTWKHGGKHCDTRVGRVPKYISKNKSVFHPLLKRKHQPATSCLSLISSLVGVGSSPGPAEQVTPTTTPHQTTFVIICFAGTVVLLLLLLLLSHCESTGCCY